MWQRVADAEYCQGFDIGYSEGVRAGLQQAADEEAAARRRYHVGDSTPFWELDQRRDGPGGRAAVLCPLKDSCGYRAAR